MEPTDRLNFRTEQDWFAIDRDEAEALELKRQLKSVGSGQEAADVVQLAIDNKASVEWTHAQKQVAYDVTTNWINDAGVDALSSKMQDLRYALHRDLTSE
jgi:hypothetical protein